MQLLNPEALRSLPAIIRPKLVTVFAKTTPELLEHIQLHATSGNLHAMAQAAHKLKGSCVSLGAEQMGDICKILQHKGEANDASETQTLSQALTRLYPETLAALQALL
jgi:HPt (histidine-containing phosphotransfer) domain-containing protein